MPAKDIFHDDVRLALEKDGWVITSEQFYVKTGGAEMYIDLMAEQLIAAQKDSQKIAVEIKSFLGKSDLSEFHLAVGQVLNYRVALRKKFSDWLLYLAVPLDTYETLFQREFVREVIEEYNLALIVFDPKK